jgi:SAM-dependent methyltransferase
MTELDVAAYNVSAWDAKVRAGDRWTVPVDREAIARARAGEWAIVLTPVRPVPRAWFGDLAGADVLCLASGGGQQGPILAAAGGRVTVFDASDAQLGQDRAVAAREGLPLTTVQGDMRDLSAFADGSFDLIFHPVSNCFCPEIRPVWRECYRVLRPGGRLLAGFTNPLVFQLEPDALAAGRLDVAYPRPYSDSGSLTPAQLERWTNPGEPLVFGHSLEDQLGGQLDAGFVLTALFEDEHGPGPEEAVDRYFAAFFATCAVKPATAAPLRPSSPG